MSYLPSSPNLNSLGSMLAKYPRRGILLFKLLEDIMSGCSPLSKEMRELIITYISELNHCEFFYKAHKEKAKELGIDEVVFDQLQTDISGANIDEKIKPLLYYIKKLTLTPDQITQTDAQRIFDAGWDEQALLDSVEICAVVNCVIRFVSGIGIDFEVPSKNNPVQFLSV